MQGAFRRVEDPLFIKKIIPPWLDCISSRQDDSSTTAIDQISPDEWPGKRWEHDNHASLYFAPGTGKEMKRRPIHAALCLSILIGIFTPSARPQGSTSPAQPKEEPEAGTSASTEALQKATQNPVSSLISVPIQNNSNFDVSPGSRTQDVLNIQPVIPVAISKDWNLIVRWIMPIVWQPVPNKPSTPETGEYGLGDMTPTFFLSPRKTEKLIWAVGPVLQLPTATNTFLGQGKLGLGPSLVLLAQPGHWTLGVLANNIWSVAGSGGRPAVNQFLMQWFVNYNLKKGWYLSAAPTVTANWEAKDGGRWVVPFGGGVGRIMKLGFQPVNISARFYGNAVHPPTGFGSSSWTMQLQIAFLFPKLTAAEKKGMLEKQLKELDAAPPQK